MVRMIGWAVEFRMGLPGRRGRGQVATVPPSTIKVWAVTKRDSRGLRYG